MFHRVAAVRATRNGSIGLIGTQATVASGAYDRAVAGTGAEVRLVSAACPAFVEFVERGDTSSDELLRLARGYLEPLRREGVDTLILGCTHYPLLRGVIEAALPGVELVDSGAAVAGDLARALSRLGVQAGGAGAETGATRRAEYYVTDDPERFRAVGVRFLGHDIEGPHLADLAPDGTAAGGET